MFKGVEIDKLEKFDKNGKEYKKIFSKVITALETNGIVDKNFLIERLEETQLSESNLIDLNQFYKKRNRINTKSKFFVTILIFLKFLKL